LDETLKTRFDLWKVDHQTLWQFIVFALVGGVTTVIELGSFTMLNFWILTPLRRRSFVWWLMDYSVENGGMTMFLAVVVSFAVSQTFNFFIQRKATFKANNNVLRSGVIYAVMVILVYFLQLYMPMLIREPFVKAFGEALGDILVKMIGMTSSMLIQFPISKWIIMRRS